MKYHTFTYSPHEHPIGPIEFRRRIERRAFERFLDRQRGSLPGTPADDWFGAEAEVYAEIGRVPPHPLHAHDVSPNLK